MKSLLFVFVSLFLTTSVLGNEWKTIKTEDAVLIEYQIIEKHDNKNDRHSEYIVFKLTNLVNQEVKLNYEFEYDMNGQTLKTDKDGTTKVSIPANGSVEGDIDNNRKLTLFHQFLVGKSGKKASDSVAKNFTINIISKK